MAGRQFVYRYDGDPQSEEAEDDFFGEIEIPKENTVIERNGKRWKVAAIQISQSVSHPPALPIYRIFLTKVD